MERRVHGGPGCGKTTHLAELVEQKVARFGAEGILLVSFTRAAALELKSRGLGWGAFKGVRIGTLHKWAYVGLGFPQMAEDHLKEWNELHPELALSSETTNLDELSGERGQSTPVDALYADYQRMRARLVAPGLWSDLMRTFDTAWAQWKAEQGLKDLTDLIDHDMPVPDGVKCVICDEAQDLTPLELRLLRSWDSSGQVEELTLVGDADQSIYSFRGASPRAFLEPDIGAENNHVLERSYRLPSVVRDYALGWIERSQFRYPVKYAAAREGGTVYSSGMRMEDAASLIQQFDDRKTMVLASCGYMLQPMIGALRDRAVPYHNPYRPDDKYWNPLKVNTAMRLRKFLGIGLRSRGTYMKWWSWRDLSEWSKATKGVFGGEAKARIARQGEAETPEDTEDRLDTATMRELMGPSWAEFERAMSLSIPAQVEWILSKLNATAIKSGSYALDVLRYRGHVTLFEEPKIIVGTVHSVKGGEADVVYLSPDVSPASCSGDPDELRRVAYVGMTRAKDKVVLLSSSGRRRLWW